MNRIIIALLVAFAAHADSFAYDFIVNGLAYNIKKDGTVALTYKNPDLTYTSGDGGYVGNVVIPKTVKYKNRTYRVTEIGERTFSYCHKVTFVKIPEGIRKIGWFAFGQLINVSSIHIPSTVKEIAQGAFQVLLKLKRLTVSPANKYYCSEGNCIYNKKKTVLVFVAQVNKVLTIPSSVTTILDDAFSGNTKMKKLVVPKSVKYAGRAAFSSMNATYVENRASMKDLPGSSKYGHRPLWTYQPCFVTPGEIKMIE